MTYELAKELKDAGFPQQDRHFYWSNHTTQPTRWDINVIDAGQKVEDEVAAPTPEELIEACGDRFDNLRRIYDGSFVAETIGKEPQGGATAAEAVARLWLALQ